MLLALDLATSTGVCEGTGEGLPRLSHVTMPDTKEEVGPFLDFWMRWFDAKLLELIEDGDLETIDTPAGKRLVRQTDLIVCFEAPLLPKASFDPVSGKLRQAPTTIATTRKLQGLAGVTEMVCFRRGVGCEEIFLQTVKKALGGSGKADKPDMMAAARKCGLAPKTYDEADAFGVWICMVRAYARAFQHLWDRRLFGSRGSML